MIPPGGMHPVGVREAHPAGGTGASPPGR
jgi:hypothetical protein